MAPQTTLQAMPQTIPQTIPQTTPQTIAPRQRPRRSVGFIILLGIFLAWGGRWGGLGPALSAGATEPPILKPSSIKSGDPGTSGAKPSPSDKTPSPANICQSSADKLPPGTLLTSTTVCQGGLTPPSLWWTRDLVESDLRLKKLVNQWTVQVRSADQAGLVKVVVNPQLWSVMNYFERYEFLNSFGLAVQEFGYNLSLSDLRGASLGNYECQFATDSPGTDSPGTDSPETVPQGRNCRLKLETGSGLRARSRTGLLNSLP